MESTEKNNSTRKETHAVLAFIIGYLAFSLFNYPIWAAALKLFWLYDALIFASSVLAPLCGIAVALLINKRNEKEIKSGALALCILIGVLALGQMFMPMYGATPTLDSTSLIIAIGGFFWALP